jgi:hypothetical protein
VRFICAGLNLEGEDRVDRLEQRQRAGGHRIGAEVARIEGLRRGRHLVETLLRELAVAQILGHDWFLRLA